MLQQALAYAADGLRVFPVHTVRSDGSCSCGRPGCKHPGKHPAVRGGVKAATTDPATITGWWQNRPDANIAVATGSGLLVVDLDSIEQIAQFRELALEHGGIPATAVVETGRGAHFWFSGQLQGSRTIDGILYRGEGGYVIAPPSRHVSGKQYQWLRQVSRCPVPTWLMEHINGARQPNDSATGNATCGVADLGPVPDHVKARKIKPVQYANGHVSVGFARMADQNVGVPCNPAEIERIESALYAISPDCDRETWLRAGMALHSLDWHDRDGDIGFGIWDAWSSGSETKYSAHDCEVVWRSFTRSGVTIGTLFHLAEQHGWVRPALPPPHVSPTAAAPGVGTSGAGPSPGGTTPPLGGGLFGPPPVAQLSPLDRLNQQYAVIGDIGGKCLVLGWVPSKSDSTILVPSFQTFDAFRNRYSHQYVMVQDGNGNVEPKQIGSYWLKSATRRTYDHVDMKPDAPPIIPPNTLNLWRGFGVTPQPGDWSLMKRHIGEVIAANDTKSAEYIIRWCAWAVQHPGERAEVALVLRGGRGAGKGTFAHAVRRLFGQHGLHISSSKHLVGSFNGHLRACCLLFADEAFWAGDKQGESILKALLTEPTIAIEQKGLDPVEMINRLHVIMSANAEWVVPAAHDERRYAVFEVSDAHQRDYDYWRALHLELYYNGGLAAMLYDLLHADLGDWHPRRIIMTKALAEQKQRSLQPLQEWFQEILDTGELPYSTAVTMDEGRVSSAVMLLNHAREWSGRLRDLNPTQLGRYLAKQGCIRLHRGTGIFWKFPPLVELREKWGAMYQREFVLGETWRVKQ